MITKPGSQIEQLGLWSPTTVHILCLSRYAKPNVLHLPQSQTNVETPAGQTNAGEPALDQTSAGTPITDDNIDLTVTETQGKSRQISIPHVRLVFHLKIID